MTNKTPTQETESKPKTKLLETLWSVPKYGVSVMASSLAEAVKKAKEIKQ